MTRPVVVWMAGQRWDAQVATERRLALALGRRVHVVWCDPVSSWWAVRAGRRPGRGVAEVADGVDRVTAVGPPGVTRPGVGDLAQQRLVGALKRHLLRLGQDPTAVVLADPTGHFPPLPRARRVLFATDDWPAGAALMGVSYRRLQRLERRNARTAAVAVAVSPVLARRLATRTGLRVAVVPNGCDPATGPLPVDRGGSARAGLVGTINERIDLALLEAVVDRGVPLVVVGPLTARSAEFRHRFEALVQRPDVEWDGPSPAAEVPGHLAGLAAGLTPYTATNFNRSSFPIKTLDYLAAGLRVVASPLPAHDWLDTPLVVQARGPLAYAAAVARAVHDPLRPGEPEERIAFARQHSWEARADDLLQLLIPSRPRHPSRATDLLIQGEPR